MLAYVIEKPGVGVIKDIPTPEPKNHEVLIKVMAAGLCGTDGHIYQGDYYSSFPLVPGHEFSGIVTKAGKDVKYFKEGQKVAADPNIFCEKCTFCKQNKQNFCRDFEAAGVTRDGAFAQYVSVPEACVFNIGELDFPSGALIEPLACVVYGQERARPNVGDTILIYGAGPIGLLHTQLALHNGAAAVIVADLNQERLALAKALGAKKIYQADGELEARIRSDYPDGFDLVIDTTGVPKVLENAVTMVKDAGTLLIFGVCPQNSKVEFNPYDIYKRDLRIIGSFALKKTFQPAVDLLINGKIDVKPIIGMEIELTGLSEQLERMVRGKANMKTIVYPNGK